MSTAARCELDQGRGQGWALLLHAYTDHGDAAAFRATRSPERLPADRGLPRQRRPLRLMRRECRNRSGDYWTTASAERFPRAIGLSPLRRPARLVGDVPIALCDPPAAHPNGQELRSTSDEREAAEQRLMFPGARRAGNPADWRVDGYDIGGQPIFVSGDEDTIPWDAAPTGCQPPPLDRQR